MGPGYGQWAQTLNIHIKVNTWVWLQSLLLQVCGWPGGDWLDACAGGMVIDKRFKKQYNPESF